MDRSNSTIITHITKDSMDFVLTDDLFGLRSINERIKLI